MLILMLMMVMIKMLFCYCSGTKRSDENFSNVLSASSLGRKESDCRVPAGWW